MRRAFTTAGAGLAAIALIAGTTASAAGVEHGPRRPAQLQRALDTVVASGGVGAVAEVRDEHGVWKGHSGTAELGTRRAVPANSRFRIGSVTKTFVATAVLQLVDRGRLRLDDPVERWLPGVVPQGDEIDVRNLLNHTSGLFDYLHTLVFPPSPAFLDFRWTTWTSDQLLQRALSHPPVSTNPGVEFDYSDTNYILLGEIIEKVTGRPYGDVIKSAIIDRLHLSGTSVPGTSPVIPGPHMHGYVPIGTKGDNKLVDYTEANPSVMGAAGGMISTTSDLDKFLGALFGGRLVSPELLGEMIRPGTDPGRYGLGLFIVQTACGITVYGHDGDTLSYNAWTYSTRDGRRQVAIGVTPNFDGNVDAAVQSLVDKAFCD